MLATIDIIAADGQATDNNPHDGVFDSVDTMASLITTKTSGGAAEERGMFEFDLSAISGSTIQSATFSFFVTAIFSSGATIGIYGYAGDGSISLNDATETSNRVASKDFESIDDLNNQSIDVTSFVQGLITGGESFAGFMLRNELSSGGIRMRSSEAGGTWPTLNVTYDHGGDPSGDPISIAIDNVQELKGSGDLTAKDAKKLVKRLNKAQHKLEDGKPDKAIKELHKFIKDVNKWIKKEKLSEESGQELIELANIAIDDFLDGSAL